MNLNAKDILQSIFVTFKYIVSIDKQQFIDFQVAQITLEQFVYCP